MKKQKGTTMTLSTELESICGKQVYFHDRDNHEKLSGIYIAAPLAVQAPETGTILLFRDGQQAWVKPEQVQPDNRLKPIKAIQRIVLMAQDEEEPRIMKFQFRSLDVASLLLNIANNHKGYTHTVATGKALEWLSEFNLRSEWVNEGCTLMTYDHWKEQYTGNAGEIL